MEKVKKVLIIVFLALSIASLVFTLMKKTGLCAEETPLPIIVNENKYENLYNIPISRIKEIVEENTTNNTYAVSATEDNGVRIRIFEYTTQPKLYSENEYDQSGSITVTEANTILENNGTVYFGRDSEPKIVKRTTIDINLDGTYNITGIDTFNFQTIGQVTITTTKYILASGDITNGTDGQTVFKVQQGHSKGGILVEVNENDEIAEEELTGVDTTTPSDPTNNSAWYQKILNAIGRVNTSIQGGIITTTDYLQQLLAGQRNFQLDLLATLGVLSGKLDGINQGTPEQIASDWVEGYENSDLYEIKTTFEHTKGGIQAMFTPSSNALVLGNWSLYRTGEHLYLEGLYTLPDIFGRNQQHIILNFDWYNSIRSWFVPLVVSLMTIGLTVTIFKGMPSMIQGAGTTFKTINDKESK